MNDKKRKKEQDTHGEKYPMYASDNFFKKPVVKLVIGAGILFGTLYVSKYFLNASADVIRACKNVKNAIMGI